MKRTLRIEAIMHDGRKVGNMRCIDDGYIDLVEQSMRDELAYEGVTPLNAKAYRITYRQEDENVAE